MKLFYSAYRYPTIEIFDGDLPRECAVMQYGQCGFTPDAEPIRDELLRLGVIDANNRICAMETGFGDYERSVIELLESVGITEVRV